MKRMNLLWAMLALFSALSFGQKKYEMVIEKTDGTESVFSTEDVVRSYFREKNQNHGYTSCPDSNHPHMIDLGLPSGTKWACCNVGAKKPEQYGGYYAWGEVSEKSYYDWSTYSHCDGTSSSCRNLGSDIAGTQYDVAHVQWGGSWVMPSLDQIKELLDHCSSEWTTVNGVYGRRFTGSNGGSIFLPAAGRRWNGDLYYVGASGYYWSSTQSPDYSDDAYDLCFYSGYANWGNYYRDNGQSVRPVVRN